MQHLRRGRVLRLCGLQVEAARPRIVRRDCQRGVDELDLDLRVLRRLPRCAARRCRMYVEARLQEFLDDGVVGYSD
jgi:hypothetical protein